MSFLQLILAFSMVICIAAMAFLAVAILTRRRVPSSRVTAREEPGKTAVNELPLSTLDASDQVLISTLNSTYVFTLNDPEAKAGTLSGGQLGDAGREVVLIGAVDPEGADDDSPSHRSLKTHSRALFFMQARNGIERLMTSAVTRLVHIKGHGLPV